MSLWSVPSLFLSSALKPTKIFNYTFMNMQVIIHN